MLIPRTKGLLRLSVTPVLTIMPTRGGKGKFEFNRRELAQGALTTSAVITTFNPGHDLVANYGARYPCASLVQNVLLQERMK